MTNVSNTLLLTDSNDVPDTKTPLSKVLSPSALSSTRKTTTTTTTTTSSHHSYQSKLPAMFAKYQQSLQKMDALEQKLEEKVLEKRHRALNLLDELSNVRHSTLRIFVTHECHENVEDDTDAAAVANDDNDDDDVGEDDKRETNEDDNKAAVEEGKKKEEKEDNSDKGDEQGGEGIGKQEVNDAEKEGQSQAKDNSGEKDGHTNGGSEKTSENTGPVASTNTSANSSASAANADTNDNDVTMKGDDDNNSSKNETKNDTGVETAATTSKLESKTNQGTVTKWKLVIEGKQLIPQLDHQSSKQMEKYLADDDDYDSAVGGSSDGENQRNKPNDKPNEQQQQQQQQNVHDERKYKYVTQTTDAAKLSVYNKMTDREKISARFNYDREGEDVLQPLLFTHFWDRISVSFQPYCRKVFKRDIVGYEFSGDDGDTNAMDVSRSSSGGGVGGVGGSGVGSATGSKKRKRSLSPLSSTFSGSGAGSLSSSLSSSSKKKGNQSKAPKQRKQKEAKFKPNGPPTNLIWNRSNNKDSRAFHAIYEQHHHPTEEGGWGGGARPLNIEDEKILEHMVVATIRLHRRANYSSSGNDSSAAGPASSTGGSGLSAATGSNTGEQKYKLSKLLCSTLFPCFLPKKAGAKIVGGGISNSASNSGGGGSAASANLVDSSANMAPLDNDIQIPKVFTMDELLTAFYIYIKDNKLQHPPTSTTASSTSTSTATSVGTAGAIARGGTLLSVPKQQNDESINATTTATAPGVPLATPIGSEGTTEGEPPAESVVTSLVYNDAKLQSIFHKSTMHFHEIQQLLLSKNLIIPAILGTPGDAPIVFTYIMKKDTESINDHYAYEDDLNKKMKRIKTGKQDEEKGSKDVDDKEDAKMKEDEVGGDVEKMEKKSIQATNEKKLEGQSKELLNKQGKNDGKGDRRKKGESKKMKTTRTTQKPSTIEYETLPNLLSCDVDIDVPHLYHFRTRDILRRIKIREYEYASVRTKAIRSIQQTRISEIDAKMLLEDIVKGNGLTKGHIPVCLALAKASQEGGEARIGSHIDARISMLMDRLEYHVRNAKACWYVVDTCRAMK